MKFCSYLLPAQFLAILLLFFAPLAHAKPLEVELSNENLSSFSEVLVAVSANSEKSFWCRTNERGRLDVGILKDSPRKQKWISLALLIKKKRRAEGKDSPEFRELKVWRRAALKACRDPQNPPPSPSPEPTLSPTPEPSASPSPEPSTSPTPEPSNTPTPEPSGSPTSEPTSSPTPVSTPEPSPSPQETPTATPESTPIPSPTQSAGGWTEFIPQPGARVIYVSSAGNDAAAGTISEPKQTLAGGYAALRNGQADWLLLKRGDVFSNPSYFVWTKSGPADADAGVMRLGAYGNLSDPRPVIDTESEGTLVITPGYQSANRITNLAISDIHMLASDRLADPANSLSAPTAIQTVAVEWQGASGYPFSNLLFENLYIQGYSFGFAMGDDIENLIIRRSIFDHIFRQQHSDSTGILTGAQGFLLEENIFYSIQSPNIPGLGSYAFASRSHAVYVPAGATNVTTLRNIMINTPDGIMQRPGGLYSRNVSAHCNVAGLMGQAWGVTPTAGGVDTRLRDSLILNPLGLPFFIGNTASGEVSNNLFVRDLSGAISAEISLVGINGANIGVHNTSFMNNILSGGIQYNPSDTASFSGLSFQGNQFNTGQLNTSIAAYLSAIGATGNDIHDLAEILLERDRANFADIPDADSIINFYRVAHGLALLDE